MLLYFFFFFFFQAEDGIRDHCVTGVQTCALPISRVMPRAATMIVATRLEEGQKIMVAARGITRVLGFALDEAQLRKATLRSEERRVGKECSYGWGRDKCKERMRGES